MARMARRWAMAVGVVGVAGVVALLLAGGCGGIAGGAEPGAAPGARTAGVRFVTDEAEAALALLERSTAGTPIGEDDWARLFETEGYRRLKAREASLGRAFDDDAFRRFLLADTLSGRAPALRRALAEWVDRGVEPAARRAFRYLPTGAVLRAKVYPVIKPQGNSFVFEPRTDPAIFLYLDPSVGAARLENILAHELHHIGLSGTCTATGAAGAGEAEGAEGAPAMEPGVAAAVDWMGAFGEGLAVLAAAGGPDVHPHATSDSAERAVWDRDVARVAEDMERLESFFMALMDGRLSDEEARQEGFSFIVSEGVPQGPFYTVGWHMAATIERELGRTRLVADVCDPVALVRDYERAAARVERGGRAVPRWSRDLLARLPG